jgi:hypothetical protein
MRRAPGLAMSAARSNAHPVRRVDMAQPTLFIGRNRSCSSQTIPRRITL